MESSRSPDIPGDKNETLLTVTCTPASGTCNLGSASQYIYQIGYHYHAGLSGGMPMPLTSTETLIASAWYPKTAQTTLTGMNLTNTTHYALGVPVYLDGKSMEMRVSGFGVYAKLLADSVVSKVGNGELIKTRKGKAPAEMLLGLLGASVVRW